MCLESWVNLDNAMIGDTRKLDCAPKLITTLPCLPWKYLSRYNVLMYRLAERVTL
jgi:hypothetical protein